MSSLRRFFNGMKEAGGKVLEKSKRTSRSTPTEQQLDYPTYESDDTLFVHATSTDIHREVFQSNGTEHIPRKIIHNDMRIGPQRVFYGMICELDHHHADKSNTVPQNGNVLAENNNSFEPLVTINTSAQWNTTPEGPHNLRQNLHGEERMYFDDQLEEHNSNVGLANTREGQVASNIASYDANHHTGQSEGRMQAVGMSDRRMSRGSDLSFPLGPLNEEDLSGFSTLTQEEFEEFNRLINGSFEESSAPVLEFTEADQALLDAIVAEESEPSLTNYPYQAGLSVDFPQEALVPTSQDPTMQSTDYLQEIGTIYYPLQQGMGYPDLPEDEPVPSHNSPQKSGTMPYPLAAMVESTTMELPTDIDHPTQYQEGSSSPICADRQSPVNHNGKITGNYQAFAPLPGAGTRRPVPDVDFQHLSASRNVARAAQNLFEHDPLHHKPENGEYNGAVPFQANDIGAYPAPPYGGYIPAESSHPNPAMTNYAENNFRAGGEIQQAYYHPKSAENGVVHDTENGVPGKKSEIDKSGKDIQSPKKRPDWATRPDAVRPRVSMTEEEYQWLRPGKPPRDIFATARRKADDKRMKEEAMADAMERAGKPRPKPKKQMPIKGGVHIEEWEKERLNDYRKSRGMLGRSIFTAKPQTRGKRKAREVADADPRQEPKKQRLSENGDHGFGTINGVKEDMSDGRSRNDTGKMSGYPSMKKGRGRKRRPAPTVHTQHNHNKYVSIPNGQSGQVSEHGGGTSRVPRPSHVGPAQNSMGSQLQPPRRPQMFGAIVSPWTGADPAYPLVENGVTGTLPVLATEDGQAPWFFDSTDLLNQRQGNLQDFNSLIDPRLRPQAQFPAPREETGAPKRGRNNDDDSDLAKIPVKRRREN
ncbi:hypothetical protein OCU04_003429 [Sclerotinia nivalis]|uniref:Uncharacterized protein n=1 Tax=Sclerotinia nivalis TaxID=352851 RepID=A0A9X0ARW3_9HELO|nr:hypothetical protein OCU04_003429 [Sclerotinia nivalis]